MGFAAILKFLLVLILPLLILLMSLNLAGFEQSFYNKKFSEYKVQENVPDAMQLHESIINFVKGKNNTLPNELMQREKEHLLDVRNLASISKTALYILIGLFMLLLISAALVLKVNNKIINFAGNVLIFGGLLAVAMAALLFLSIVSGFSAGFETFHKLFFEKGTYLFDPAKEIIVRLYPEQLFMDLGIRISAGALITSAAAIMLGLFLLLKSKKKKNKNRHNKIRL